MPHPPQIILRFFRWYVHPKLRDSIEGDLIELYRERVREKGKRKADILFAADVLLCLRRGIIRPAEGHQQINTYGMLKNYFTIGWRSLLKQRMYSAIKIGGFALGIAACILISLFIKDELSYDKQYPNANRIYRVIGVGNHNGQLSKGVHFQPPMAKALREEYIEIEKVGRYNNVELFGAANAEVRRADQMENLYEDHITFIDQALFDIFQPKFIYGNPAKALAEPLSVVLTRSKAEKYYPGENPLGKSLIFNDDKARPFTIGGVIEDLPPNTHLPFDIFLTLSGWEFWKGEQTSWCCSNYPTYIQIKEGTDPHELAKKITKGVIDKYIIPMLKEEGRSDIDEIVKNSWIELQPVTDIHLKSEGIWDGLSHGDIRFVWLFSAVAAFILIIASINFINLSTARSANRAKEVGLRKVVGSVRSNLVGQFLAESLLYSVLSFVFGLVLAILLLPYFNIVASKSLEMPWLDWWFVPALVAASLFVGVLAGIYPALYLSSFRPIQVLKGNLSMGSRSSSLRGGLVVFQFTISIVLIVGTFIIYRQMNFILNKKLGYDKQQVLYMEGTHMLGNQIQTFKEELKKLPMVKSVSISDYLPVRGTKRNGNQFSLEGRGKIDKPVSGQFWRIDHDYIKTLGMHITDGRDFDRDMASDSSAALINQEMVKQLGLKDPLGARIVNYSQTWTVIGVVENFNFESLKHNIDPVMLTLGNSPTIVSMKISSEDLQGTIASVTEVWKKFAPNQPARFAFLDESYARMYDDVKRMGKIFTSFAVFAIIVACLGLFALSAFMVEQRSKEISIRLVLGASMNNIVRLLTQNFMALIMISIVLATPIAWYVMQKWLEDFAFRVEMGWEIFLLAGLLSIFIAVVTISFQAIRAALTNPVNGLRSE